MAIENDTKVWTQAGETQAYINDVYTVQRRWQRSLGNTLDEGSPWKMGCPRKNGRAVLALAPSGSDSELDDMVCRREARAARVMFPYCHCIIFIRK